LDSRVLSHSVNVTPVLLMVEQPLRRFFGNAHGDLDRNISVLFADRTKTPVTLWRATRIAR
jgi:hypothetical protein